MYIIAIRYIIRKPLEMSSVSCSICLEIITSTCIASYLNCGHVYHHNCLENWFKTVKTCPECRNVALTPRRIYLNLVPDPEIESLNLEITETTKKLVKAATDNEIQAIITMQLRNQLSTKDQLLISSAKQNDELKSNSTTLMLQKKKLELELELQEKQQFYLNNDISDLRNQLQASQTKNIEITKLAVTLKNYCLKQINQISDLRSQITDLTERLDQSRRMFAVTDLKLQVQIRENRAVKIQRDSLLNRNIHLYQKMSSLKLQSHRTFLRKIKRKYNGLVQQSSAQKPQSTWRNGKRDIIKTAKNGLVQDVNKEEPNNFCQFQIQSNDNLKIKLIKRDNLKPTIPRLVLRRITSTSGTNLYKVHIS